MLSIQIDTHELTRFAEKLTIFADALPGVTHSVAKSELEAGVEVVRTYPSRLPGQRYKRTGEYGDKTNLVSPPTVGKTMKFEIISAAIEAKRGRRYSSYVGGTAVGGLAARIHVGRWKNLYQEIVKTRLPKLIGEVDAAIQAKAASLGIK